MSKRQRGTVQRPPQDTVRQGRAPSRRGRRLRTLPWWLHALVFSGAGLLIALVWWRSARVYTPVLEGDGGACRTTPAFATRLGGSSFSTSEPQAVGLVLLRGQGEPYRDPTWDDAGPLGPLVRDGSGALYTAPLPRVSTVEGARTDPTVIWRIDAQTGSMAPWVTIPAAAPPSAQNPYGIIDLAYDCASGTLFASTLTGSTRQAARGRIVGIDVASGQVRTQHDDLDALGLAVWYGADGGHLLVGSARTPEVWSLPLGRDGTIGRDLRPLLALPGTNGANRAGHIAVTDATTLQITGTAFNYTLQAQSAAISVRYRATYDAPAEQWRIAE